VNKFSTTRTVSKGKSTGRSLISDEIVEDLREEVEETRQISRWEDNCSPVDGVDILTLVVQNTNTVKTCLKLSS
jgi:hypothetical protein